jgi:hypothetical protein
MGSHSASLVPKVVGASAKEKLYIESSDLNR